MRKILTLLFVLFLSASAFGDWVAESAPYPDIANVFAAYPTSNSLTIAVGLINGNGNVYVTSDYAQGQPWTPIPIPLNPPPDVTAMTYGGSRLLRAAAHGSATGMDPHGPFAPTRPLQTFMGLPLLQQLMLLWSQTMPLPSLKS